MTESPPLMHPRPIVGKAPPERPLNVKDALSYLNAVKVQFQHKPDVYNLFLDIMKDFKGQLIDTPGVIQRVAHLFHGHPLLISEFNTFLPYGYQITVMQDPKVRNAHCVRVATPGGNVTDTTIVRTPSVPLIEDIQPALDYVQKIKTRFVDEPERYRKFLDILSTRNDPVLMEKEGDVMLRVHKLLHDAPDLMNGLWEFLGEDPIPIEELEASVEPKGSKPKQEPQNLPQKRKRKDKEREKDGSGKAGSSKRHKSKREDPRMRPPEVPYDENNFFERVRRHLDNQTTHNEFLKLINLFTQEFIDSARLLKEARTYLGEGELMMQLKAILGWDERRELYAIEDHFWPASGNDQHKIRRPRSGTSIGSYVRLPASETNVTCSGRDAMCKSVLNDEWVSRPSFASEDSGFMAHKKNIYEEALHRSEEERHEYDFHIEAIVKTIGLLEPINNKISQLNPEDRGQFKLKPNFGGAGKSIHHRVIRKIYGREAGEEVIRAMQDSPAVSIPVVLARLKQKEEEWKRAQREWNKVWREVDARNYYKSLDHQGIVFKASDKKATTPKAFINQIEAARAEQVAKRAAYIDPLFARVSPTHQLEFTVEDVSVLQDTLKLVFSFLDRTTGQLSPGERKRVEGFLRTFVPIFFKLDTTTFNFAFTAMEPEEISDDIGSGSEEEAANNSKSGKGRKGGNGSGGGDLRKKLLNDQAKAKSKGRAGPSQPTATPSADAQAQSPGQDTVGSPLFCNTTFYVLLRLLEASVSLIPSLLYSRLSIFKTLGAKLAKAGPRKTNPAAAAGIGLSADDERFADAAHFYEFLLESCEKLFDNEIEVPLFEDQMRFMFGPREAYKIFTVDKVIGSIIKQVQTIFTDAKSQDLYNLFKKEGQQPSDEGHYREASGQILGDSEHLFRIEILPHLNVFTVQLLGKDDPSQEDPEIYIDRWRSYITSYTSETPTKGLAESKIKPPFLRRNRAITPDHPVPAVIAGNALEMKICVRTYRIFYVSNTVDFFYKPSPPSLAGIPRRSKGVWFEKLKAES
ncbi:hypothetical protein BDM02DRAFT_3153710 [Thelephora ganbajun]|uniref:Uncharacterized protein n=1 Tax=Thelephora ganbajun TaxID=370292 RepID=A0ACB6ZT14_THEGA|nr:hypothetical protein BDM02DRAFT_3153710 [Thelephora ganbajun]